MLGVMASVHDVADCILEATSPISTWKLQKLAYYAQAWSLVWDEEQPLYPERIEAWANGPVVPELFKQHRGKFSVSEWPLGDWRKLSEKQRKTVKAVVDYYGRHTGHWLRELTHSEDPWRKARKGLPASAPSSAEITPESMLLYYQSL
jgi:uncharacterized phage-associated protein